MMTDRQRQVINAMLDAASAGNGVTLRDLAHRLGMRSHSQAAHLVERLEARGLVKRRRGRPPVFSSECFQVFAVANDGKLQRRDLR